MRFTWTIPASADDLKAMLRADLDTLSPGLRVLTANVPLAGLGTIDALAVDGRGRPALIIMDLVADGARLDAALAQWEWAATNIAFLAHLAPQIGLDPTQAPRLMIAATRIEEAVQRVAACLQRPEIELYEVTMVAAGEQRGVLARRLDVKPVAAPAGTIDPLMAPSLTAEARSLLRRVAEELRDLSSGGRPITLQPLVGGIDVSVEGRHLGAIVATPAGVEARRPVSQASMPVGDDAACRQAVAFLLPAPQPAVSFAAPERPTTSGPAAALTPEEIAEFEGMATGAGRAPLTVELPLPRQPASVAVEETREPAGVPLRPGSSWYVEN